MSTGLPTKQRIKISFVAVLCGFLMIFIRLFYWQIIKADTARSVIQQQTINKVLIRGQRGRIFTSDEKLLVGNQTVYDIYLNKNELEINESELIEQISKIFQEEQVDNTQDQTLYTQVFFSHEIEKFEDQLNQNIAKPTNWIKILDEIPPLFNDKLIRAKIKGLHPIETEARYYPEASMAAHMTGFVGKDRDGEKTGYFGIEGALNKELQGDSMQLIYRKDGTGVSFADQKLNFSNLDGRDISLTIRRDIQLIAETALKKGIEQSKSKSGEVVIIDPKTGAILALASWPSYDQARYQEFSTSEYKNPTIANLYEPGSTFKVITLATALDLGLITPETECTKCSGPRVIAGYTINTWNKEFHPNITMTEALKKSDNIAMVFVSEQIGANQFLEYIKLFGIGESMMVDLQEDSKTPLPQKVGPIELATMSFGQGIMTSSLQMTRAVGIIANNGVMMKTHIISSVYDPRSHETIYFEPQEVRRVIQTNIAQTLVQMMIESASKRNNWVNQNFVVAGKSGTSQIPSDTGGYKETGTIASYIGFAPAENAKFVMLVKLTEPQSDLWGETTAVPIWFEIAEKMLLIL